jgi:WD40 repeat protein
VVDSGLAADAGGEAGGPPGLTAPPVRPCGDLGLPGFTGFGTEALFSPDGAEVLLPGHQLELARVADGAVVLRTRLAARPVALLSGHRALVATPDQLAVVPLEGGVTVAAPATPGISTGAMYIALNGGQYVLVGRVPDAAATEGRADLVRVADGRVIAEDVFRYDVSFGFSASLSADATALLVVAKGRLGLHTLPDKRTLWSLPVGDYTAAALSPDGRRVVVAMAALQLLDASSGKLVEKLGDGLVPVTFSPDGGSVMLVDSSGSQVLDLATHAITPVPGLRAQFSPDGKSVLNDALELYDYRGQLLRTLGGAYSGSVQALAFSPDGGELRVAGKLAAVRFALQDPAAPATRIAGGAALSAWSADGRWLARAADAPVRTIVTVSRADDGTMVWQTMVQPSPLGRAAALGFSPDGAVLGLQIRNGTSLQLFGAEDGSSRGSVAASGLAGFAFAVDGRVAALVGGFTALSLVVYDSRGLPQRHAAVGRAFSSSYSVPELVALSPDARFAVLGRGTVTDFLDGTGDGHLALPGTHPFTSGSYGPAGWAALFTLTNGSSLAAASTPIGPVLLVRPGSQDAPRTLDEAATAIAFSADGARLAVGHGDGTVALYCR